MRMKSSALGALLLLAFGVTANAATFVIRPQEGFDDPTPVTPVGGNPATTLGEARLNVIEQAGLIWGSLLQSNVPIIVDATFAPLDCDAVTATAAVSGPGGIFTVLNGPIRDVMYVSALADALTNTDRFTLAGSPNAPDIKLTVNSRLNGDPTCLAASRFYLGYDHNPGFNDQDLLSIVLHELAHGLGFVSFVNLDPAEGPVGASSLDSGMLSSYDQFVFDEVFNQRWTALSVDQRRISATRDKQVVWIGANVNTNLDFLTAGVTAAGRLKLFAPSPLVPGSSISHFEADVRPNILMEPSATSNVGVTDVTVCALRDMGWQVTRCPDFTLATSTSPPVSAPPPVITMPAPTSTDSTPTSGGGRRGGGGALYWPLLIALAGLVPLRSRLRRRERR